jgi:hypothetical protein
MHYFRASWYGGAPHLDHDNPPSKLLGNADHRTSQMGQSCDALKADGWMLVVAAEHEL